MTLVFTYEHILQETLGQGGMCVCVRVCVRVRLQRERAEGLFTQLSPLGGPLPPISLFSGGFAGGCGS